ncbi:MAG: hypothetical protein WD810_03675 [Solirubrobacterales bacterium]
MKRAEALRPLSREHLGALLAAKKLREASDLEEATRSFLEFWWEHGQRHFRVEEEVLGTLLHDHVRFEERELFPLIEDAMGAEDLERLAAAIERAEATPPSAGA